LLVDGDKRERVDEDDSLGRPVGSWNFCSAAGVCRT